MKRIPAAVALLLAATACARSEDPNDVRADSNNAYNHTRRVAAPERDDQEQAIGQWRQSLQDSVPALEFGPMGAQPLLSLLCTGRQSVFVQRHGGAPAGPPPELRLAIAGQEARLPVTASGGAIPMLRADMALSHPVVQALAQGSPSLTIRLGDDAAPVIIPSSTIVGDYLRSCATAQPLPAGNAAAPAVNGAAPAANSAARATEPAAPVANSAAPANASRNKQ